MLAAPDRPQPPPRGLFAAPLLVFVAVRAALLGVAAFHHLRPFEAALWMRWDAWLYVLHAKDGPTLVPCGPGTGYAPHEWCGTAGWFPLYPALIRALSAAGPPPPTSGALLSATFHLATLVLVWSAVRRLPRTPALLSLALAAVFPGVIYAHAVFPIALLHACTLGMLLALAHGRFALAGLLGALGAAAYSTGFLLVFPALAAALAPADGVRARSRLAPPLLVLAGFAAVLAWHLAATGRWNAFFLVQAKYGHGASNPLETWASSVAQLWREAALHKRWSGAQTLLASALTLPALVVAFRQRHELLPRILGVTVLTFALFPLSMGSGVALFRAEALLLPAALLLARAPLPLLAALTLASAALLPQMASMFFLNALR
jgi:hypothetical protein